MSDLIGKVRGSIKFIEERSMEELTRVDLGTRLGYDECKGEFIKIKEMTRDLREFVLPVIPEGKMNDIFQIVSRVDQLFADIEHIRADNAASIRDTTISRINETVVWYFNQVFPLIAYGKANNENPVFLEMAREAQNARHVASETRNEFDKISSRMNDQMNSASILIEQLGAHAADKGVSASATIFEREASKHWRSALLWLIFTIFLASGTAWLAHYIWKYAPIAPAAQPGTIVHEAISRLIAVSVMLFLLVWSGRNFSAHRHNYVVNKHRQNALRIFKTFVAAAGENVDVKHAVLLQATTSIFAAQPTGYAMPGQESDAIGKMADILKSVASGAK